MTPIGFLQRDKDLEIYIYIYIFVTNIFWSVLWNMNFMTFHMLGCWEQWSQLTNIFQRGWNHQPVYIYIYIARKHVFTIQLPSSNGNLKISSFFIYQSHCKWALLGPGKSHVGCEKDPASRRLDFNNVRMITMTILDCWFQTLVLYGVMMVNDG